MERPDLNGLRFAEHGTPDVWLVFHGRRHRIATPSVYISLFDGDTTGIIFDSSLELIDPGPELNDGTCLVRGSDNVGIFLVTGTSKVRRLLVNDYETFLDFGFRMDKVIEVPSLIVNAIPQGSIIVSAGSQTKVHSFSVSTTLPQINPA